MPFGFVDSQNIEGMATPTCPFCTPRDWLKTPGKTICASRRTASEAPLRQGQQVLPCGLKGQH